VKQATFWYKLTAHVPENQQDLAGALLFQEGSVGLENLPEKVCAYFRPEISIEAVVENLQKRLKALNFPFDVQVEKIPAENWNENWKQNFKPFKIGRRFFIRPSWETLPAQRDRIVLTIDPGQAFGTGTHETTQLILTLMEPVIKPGMSLWDVGTGTGILAIAAAKLGLTGILAHDTDPVAVETALKNARLNQTETAIRFFVGSANAVKRRDFDVIVMNIVSGVLLELLPDVVPALKSNGWLFLSGILAEEKPAFLDQLKLYPVRVQTIKQQGEWIGLMAQKEKAE